MPTKKKTAKKTAAKKTTKKTTVKKVSSKKTTAKKATTKKTSKKTTKKVTKRVVSGEERYLMVTEAAYYIAERNGFGGDDVRYWAEAEAQIDAIVTIK